MVRRTSIIVLSVILAGMAIFWILRRVDVSLLSFLPEVIRALPELIFWGIFLIFAGILYAIIHRGRKSRGSQGASG